MKGSAQLWASFPEKHRDTKTESYQKALQSRRRYKEADLKHTQDRIWRQIELTEFPLFFLSFFIFCKSWCVSVCKDNGKFKKHYISKRKEKLAASVCDKALFLVHTGILSEPQLSLRISRLGIKIKSLLCWPSLLITASGALSDPGGARHRYPPWNQKPLWAGQMGISVLSSQGMCRDTPEWRQKYLSLPKKGDGWLENGVC